MNKFWLWFRIISLGFMLGMMAYCLVIPQLLATIQGVDEIVLTLDQFGEQVAEAIIFPIVWIMSMVAVCQIIWVKPGKEE